MRRNNCGALVYAIAILALIWQLFYSLGVFNYLYVFATHVVGSSSAHHPVKRHFPPVPRLVLKMYVILRNGPFAAAVAKLLFARLVKSPFFGGVTRNSENYARWSSSLCRLRDFNVHFGRSSPPRPRDTRPRHPIPAPSFDRREPAVRSSATPATPLLP